MDPGLNSFSPFQEACAVIFLSRALPAASCDSKLSLGSGVQSSELSKEASPTLVLPRLISPGLYDKEKVQKVKR